MSNRAVLLLSVAALASAASVRAADPLLPLLGAQFGVSAGTASIVITAFGISYGLLQVVSAPLSDRFGKYLVVCIATLVSAVGTLACALSPSLEWLAIARFAQSSCGFPIHGAIECRISACWYGKKLSNCCCAAAPWRVRAAGPSSPPPIFLVSNA